MSRSRWIAIVLVVAIWVGGFWLAVLAQRHCSAAKGTFDWLSLTCTGGEPPLILQRDLRRT